MLRDASRLLVFKHHLEDFHRFGEHFVVVYSNLGLQLVVGDVFRMLALGLRCVACDMVSESGNVCVV